MGPGGRSRAAAICATLLILATPRPAIGRVELPPHGDRSVHDLAGVIGEEDARIMEKRHAELYQKTGVGIVVITVPRLDGEPIEDFAVRAGAEWGVGRKGEDRGIVVAFALAERRIFVATGYGVEGYLPDGRVGAILDEQVVPVLKRGGFSEGLVAASAGLALAAATEHGVTIEGLHAAPSGRERRARGGTPGPLAFVLALLGVSFLFGIGVLLQRAGFGRRGRRFPGGFYGGFPYGGTRGFGGGRSGFGGFGGGGFGGGGAGRGF